MTLADRPAFADRLRADGVRVIRMRCDNLVKAAVSQVRAQLYAEQTKVETGKPSWTVRKGEQPLGPTQIDPADLIGHSVKRSGRQVGMVALILAPRSVALRYQPESGWRGSDDQQPLTTRHLCSP